MPPSEIDRQKLRNAYRSPHMKLVMDYFATSPKDNDMEIEVDILEEYFKDNPFFGRASIIDSFKILEKLGWGYFIIGRKGGKSRFRSTIAGISSIGRIASHTPEKEAMEVEDSELSLTNEQGLYKSEKEVNNLLSHAYYLRENFVINLELPGDLTVVEAERLAGHIKTLPFRE
jgi:hypothetical protein